MSRTEPRSDSFSLTAARRARELDGLAAGTAVDVLVIGLGATGAGAALDAASRGLSVAAIDAYDLAFGTSRWSSSSSTADCATWPPGSSASRTRARWSAGC